MPRFQSSLVDSQCPSRLHKAHTPHHTTPHILTHSVLLSDPLNDRSKDCAPRGTLNGSWGSWMPHSRTLSALGANWLWCRVSSMCFLVAIVRIGSVALSGCCAPMLPLRGCRVSMRALGCRWEGETKTKPEVSHKCAQVTHQFYRRRAQPAQGGVVFSSWSFGCCC